MDIYYMDINNSIYDYNYDYFFNMIVDCQKRHISKMRFYNNKKECLYSEIILKSILINYGLNYEQLSFYKNKNGKRYLYDIPNVFFNISHSNNKVVCCLSKTEVGIDIEGIKEIKASILRRFFDKNKNNHVIYDVSDNNNFFLVWTRMEALVKAKGLNLLDVLYTLDVFNNNKELIENYYLKSYKYKDNMISVCKLNREIIESINFYEIEINHNKELIMKGEVLNEVNTNTYSK